MKSLYFAGSFAGALLGGTLSDSRGRRPTLLVMWALTAVTTTIAAAAQHWLMYAAARFILGVTTKYVTHCIRVCVRQSQKPRDGCTRYSLTPLTGVMAAAWIVRRTWWALRWRWSGSHAGGVQPWARGFTRCPSLLASCC